MSVNNLDEEMALILSAVLVFCFPYTNIVKITRVFVIDELIKQLCI